MLVIQIALGVFLGSLLYEYAGKYFEVFCKFVKEFVKAIKKEVQNANSKLP